MGTPPKCKGSLENLDSNRSRCLCTLNKIIAAPMDECCFTETYAPSIIAAENDARLLPLSMRPAMLEV